MKIQNYPIHYSDHLLNPRIVVDETGYWAIDRACNLIHNDKVVGLLFNNIELGEDNWGELYQFDDHHFMFFSDVNQEGHNTWLINKKGKVIRSFSVANYGSKHIHVQGRKIIIGYNEAVIEIPHERTAAIFDEFGNLLKEFDTKELDWEMKGICKKSEHEVIFHFVFDWAVFVLNLETLELRRYESNQAKYSDDYYSRFITYSPTTQYLYTGSEEPIKDPFDPNETHINILRGKLDDNSNKIVFEPFDKINFHFGYLPLDDGRILEIDMNGEEWMWTRLEHNNYTIIDFEGKSFEDI